MNYLNFKSCTLFALQLWCVCCSTPPPPLYDKMFDAIGRLSQQMETFNVHYITKLDEKFLAIMQTMTAIDTNVKLLQERSQAWDIFAHHMTAWSEHFKSTDQKFEILKKNLELLPLIENQLQNTDFKVQHVFERTDTLNEKFNELSKRVVKAPAKQGKIQQKSAAPRANWSQEDFEQTEILLRLSKIQRLVQSSCSVPRLDREFESAGGESPEESVELKALLSQINGNLEKFPLKEIKQSLNLNKKHERALETLATTVNHIDERTVRIFDASSYQFKKQLASYKGTEGEILAFTNNANFLLKKVEKAMRSVVADHNSQTHGEKCNGTISRSANTRPHETTVRDESSDEVEDDIIDQKDYVQPAKSNCFQLTNGRSGVYTFGEERQLNEAGRDFNAQYCEYSTEGSAWLVIQKRDNFDSQEPFNRSWSHYKHGFGNLSRDFWFGNDFVHNLTVEHDMALRIVLEDFQDNHVWIEYGSFGVGSEASRYKLRIGEYRGAVPDSLLASNGHGFITFDTDVNSTRPCAAAATTASGGWWWSKLNGDCAESNLNGGYRNESSGNATPADGIYWRNWLAHSPLKASKMMIRPKEMWQGDDHGNKNEDDNEDYTQLDDF